MCSSYKCTYQKKTFLSLFSSKFSDSYFKQGPLAWSFLVHAVIYTSAFSTRCNVTEFTTIPWKPVYVCHFFSLKVFYYFSLDLSLNLHELKPARISNHSKKSKSDCLFWPYIAIVCWLCTVFSQPISNVTSISRMSKLVISTF